jgi:hypothetical protein
MTEMSDGTIVTDIDNHADNYRLTSRATRSATPRPGTATASPKASSSGIRRRSPRPTCPTEVGDEAGSARARLHPLHEKQRWTTGRAAPWCSSARPAPRKSHDKTAFHCRIRRGRLLRRDGLRHAHPQIFVYAGPDAALAYRSVSLATARMSLLPVSSCQPRPVPGSQQAGRRHPPARLNAE